MKPVGLMDPRIGREPYAAVQLRQENLMADAYSFVGFQNHLRYGEQARVLRLIPGLERAEFLQFGQIHRNTYICSPRVLQPTMQMRERTKTFFAGQITGVEGYVESVATGWLAGVNAARLASGQVMLKLRHEARLERSRAMLQTPTPKTSSPSISLSRYCSRWMNKIGGVFVENVTAINSRSNWL